MEDTPNSIATAEGTSTEAASTEAAAGTSAPLTLDVLQIMRIIPHRYPFLLLDRIVELHRRRRVVAIKNVTINEPFFQGHFPGYPIMPGVLVIEAMAQAGALLLLTEIEDRENKIMVFTGIERAKFRKPVVPGDQLRIEVDVLAFRRTAGKISCGAYVGDKRACEAVLTCQVVDKPASEGQ
jgi:3-hydroxyacyl-[acyl-carrier-protein] dehydratase